MASEPQRLKVLLDRARELVGNIESTWDGAEVFTVEDHLRLAHKMAEESDRRVALQRALFDLERFVRSQNNAVRDVVTQVALENTSLYAYLTLLPPRSGFPVVSRTRLDRMIASAGVLMGIDAASVEGAYAKFARRREVVYRLRVASGTLPRRGEDGVLHRLVPFLEPDLLLSGRAPGDLAGLLRGVKASTSIARVLAPGSGVAGTTVGGKAIPAPVGRPCAVVPGAGTMIRERDEIVAVEPGVPTLAEGRLSVLPWEVQAGGSRIDSARGVFLAGDHVGEAVRARDLCVDGDLEGARVDVQGDLFVRGEIKNGAHVRVGGRVWAKAVSSSEVEAVGDVRIAKAATSAILVTGGRLEASEIVGGSVIALTHVQVGRLGSGWGERTSVRVGRNQWAERRREGRAQALGEAKRALDTIARSRAEKVGKKAARTLPEAEQDAVLAALAEESRLRREIDRLEAEETQVRRATPSAAPSVRVLEGLQPPVTIEIEGQLARVEEPKGPLVVLRENLASLGPKTSRSKRS